MYPETRTDRVLNFISGAVVVLALTLSAVLLAVIVGAYSSDTFAKVAHEFILGDEEEAQS